MNPADLDGRRLGMVVWSEKPDGSDEVVVFTRRADWDGKHLTMVGESGEPSFRLEDDWLDRLTMVDPSLKGVLLEADYCFSVSIGSIPEGTDITRFVKTGLRWPTEGAS
jgi:hypothetical protein